jgi:hypothetical protein
MNTHGQYEPPGVKLDFAAWDKIQMFAFWACIASCSAFFMQRLHYQNPDMPERWPRMLASIARMTIWCLYASCIYIGYKIGWLPGVICAALVFIVPVLVTACQMAFVRVSAATLTIGSAPICIISFGLALLSLGKL